jgi:hypothetical protein
MYRYLRRLVAMLDGDASTDEPSEDSWFRPSRLDASVRAAHGGGDDAVERELEAIHEQARQLDEGRRDR